MPGGERVSLMIALGSFVDDIESLVAEVWMYGDPESSKVFDRQHIG